MWDRRLLHYVGKHVPHPQKSLWSPDTPVQQDRHLFKLSTLDIDGFKYWFGVRRAMMHREVWGTYAMAGLVPPNFHGDDTLPRPVYSKEELYRYYLANRKPMATEERENYLNYHNTLERSPEERKADRPKAPWM